MPISILLALKTKVLKSFTRPLLSSLGLIQPSWMLNTWGGRIRLNFLCRVPKRSDLLLSVWNRWPRRVRTSELFCLAASLRRLQNQKPVQVPTFHPNSPPFLCQCGASYLRNSKKISHTSTGWCSASSSVLLNIILDNALLSWSKSWGKSHSPF